MIRKPVIITAVVTALTGGLFLGSRNAVRSTSAYFTDREFHTNVYTFGDVTVDGTETDWDPETAARLLPNAGSPKNPVLINTGDTAVIGFIVLDSPLLHEAVSAAEDGSRVNETNREVWQYLTAGTEGFGEGWVPVETGYADSAHQTRTRTAHPMSGGSSAGRTACRDETEKPVRKPHRCLRKSGSSTMSKVHSNRNTGTGSMCTFWQCRQTTCRSGTEE